MGGKEVHHELCLPIPSPSKPLPLPPLFQGWPCSRARDQGQSSTKQWCHWFLALGKEHRKQIQDLVSTWWVSPPIYLTICNTSLQKQAPKQSYFARGKLTWRLEAVMQLLEYYPECISGGRQVSPKKYQMSEYVRSTFMYHSHSLAVCKMEYNPSLWLMCVVNKFVVWSDEPNKLHFCTHLKFLRLAIQFTAEKQTENIISSWDIFITWRNFTMSTTVYGNPTYKGQYINYCSNHMQK